MRVELRAPEHSILTLVVVVYGGSNICGRSNSNCVSKNCT